MFFQNSHKKKSLKQKKTHKNISETGTNFRLGNLDDPYGNINLFF